MKKLIIVCEEKLRSYADFLAQLISRQDDTEDSLVGVKDGSTAGQVWSDKEYSSNAVHLSSEQYVLFIGNSKMMKEKRIHMQKKFSQYGMNYGWLGKQAALFVDHIVSSKEYDAFYEFASDEFRLGDQQELQKLLGVKEDNATDEDTVQDVVEAKKANKNTDDKHNPVNNVKKILSPIGHAIKGTTEHGIEIASKAAGTISLNIKKVVKSHDIEAQEYSCLILLFYLNGLSEFLKTGEDK